MRQFFAILLVMALFITCVGAAAPAADAPLDYKSISDVTQAEIDAIEAIKAGRTSLSYGALLSTEAFLDEGGNLSGYTYELCRLLSRLFGIRFTPAIYGWKDIVSKMADGSLDFSGDMSLTPERQAEYHMSAVISVRSIALFYRQDEPMAAIAKTRKPILGFLDDSVHIKMLQDAYGGRFEAVYIDRVEDAPAALESRTIDAFVCNNIFEALFERGSGVVCEIYSPLIFDSVSLATQSDALAPFISVFDKYIKDDGRDTLSELYAVGLMQHTRSMLAKALTDTEKAYIRDHVAANIPIPVILESGNYPICFYNTTSGEYQGIVPDLLVQVTAMTGLGFVCVNQPEDDWSTVMAMLQSGEAALISELLQTPTREGLFLWPEAPFCETRYALLSRIEMPNLEVNQLLGKRIGVEAGTAHETMASQWFSDVTLVNYASIDDAFDGLDRGEIDLIMASENLLLSQTNFRERPGYKVNFAIDYTAQSKLGFNVGEGTLLTVFEKALPFAGGDVIVRNWASRIFDYSGQLAQARVRTLLISTVLLTAFMALLVVFLVKNNRNRHNLANEVKARTAQLEDKTTTLSTIYGTIPDMLYSKDILGRYTSCNHSFEVLTGRPESGILGKRSSDIFANLPPADLAAIAAQDDEVIHMGSTTIIEEWITYPNGEHRLLETVKTALRQNDVIVGMIGISRDITAHKEAEKAAFAALEAKSSFLAHMSHEIRTPLNAIIGMSEIAKNSIGNVPKTVASVGQIIVSSHHLLGLINNVLDMSKIEAGNLEVLSQPMFLREALAETLTIVSSRCLEKDISFAHNVDEVPDLVINGDKLHLNQVLINLLSNAIKFTDPHGVVQFHVEILAESDADVGIRFAIKDSGIGMTDEQMSRLFRPFEQADSTIASRFGGTGLGLSISQSLVQMMGGVIEISSTLGEGSVFSFEVTFSKGELAAQAATPDAPEEMDFSHARILLAEDIDINRYIVQELLGPTGVTIDEAVNGRDAVEKFTNAKAGTYQLIFMDIQMPELDGYGATAAIRASGKRDAESIPIVAMTANAYKEDVERALGAGMNAHVGKPIDIAELIKTMAVFLPAAEKA